MLYCSGKTILASLGSPSGPFRMGVSKWPAFAMTRLAWQLVQLGFYKREMQSRMLSKLESGR
jgi:hypothetical protein